MEFDRNYKIDGTPIRDLSDDELKQKIQQLVGARTTITDKPARAPKRPGAAAPDLSDIEEF